MQRLSKQLEKLENYLSRKIKRRVRRAASKLAGKWPLLLIGWYFLGMLINSISRGIAQTFPKPGTAPPESLWEFNPIYNLAAVFTPTGLGVIFFCALMIVLMTKKGYNWLSGCKLERDPRGFDIVPDGTHGTGGWMDRKHLEAIFDIGTPRELSGTILGKLKESEEDSDKDAEYISPKPDNGLNKHILIYGASGTGKSRGFIKPFIMQAIARKESAVILDPKGELYESTSAYARKMGMVVKAYNLLDMPNSDGFNCISDIESDKSLVQSVAEVIIRNTSNANERQDFWESATCSQALKSLCPDSDFPLFGELVV